MTRGRIAFATSLLAILIAGGLFVSAFTVSMYSDGGTLYGQNGPEILPAILLPVALAVIAFAGLSAQCTSGSLVGQRAAIVAMAILGVFTILTGFSIGILVLPITALVAIAVATTPAPAGLDDVFDDVE